MPVFVIAYLLAYVFALELDWLPVQGYTPISHGFWPWLQNLILPAIALGAVYIALIARMTRATMLEVLQQDYIKTARAKGIGQGGILFVHALKNAAVPIVTVIGLGIATLIGGAVVTESVFVIPGLGRLTVEFDPAARLSGDPGPRPALQLRLCARQSRHRPHLHLARPEDPLLSAVSDIATPSLRKRRSPPRPSFPTSWRRSSGAARSWAFACAIRPS